MGVQPQFSLPAAFFSPSSSLLDIAASDDLDSFKLALSSGLSPSSPGLWYSPIPGSRSLSLENRTPLMIAALHGSNSILRYILSNKLADVNTNSTSDGSSALHLAVSSNQSDSISLLLSASANPNSLTNSNLRPSDLIKSNHKESNSESLNPDPNPALPDINVGVYGSDEFRMYGFKIRPCSRAYTHDWTECPFAHPGENARRRDPLKIQYSCVPCPEFKKGSCRKGDACEYAHGVFESWLHPAQYRTRLCKDETGCNRKVCFFAHRKHELRPVFASTGSAIDSMDTKSSSPMSPSFNCSTPPPNLSRLRSTTNARDVDLEMELFLLESQIRSGYPANPMSPLSHIRSNNNNYPAMSPSRKLSPTDSPKSVAAAMLNSRAAAAAAFVKRSQSFVDRGAYVGNNVGSGFGPSWGNGGGRADWSVQEGDLSKLRRSASFGQRGGAPRRQADVSNAAWLEQMYIEQEQMVA